jgi:type I restriction enzyme S subunit
MSTWKKTPLAAIQASEKWAMNGGPFGSKLTQKDYAPHGVPVIRGSNLSGDSRFYGEGFVFVSEAKAEELRANIAIPGDVVFTQRGTLGDVGLIPAGAHDRYVISQSQMKLTIDPQISDPRFIYYVFKNPITQKEIKGLASTSGVPHINLSVLREFRVLLPPLPSQRRIGDILCAYDDLIDNCEKRIWIMEQMAHSLYREWFVHFRYPGGGRIVDQDKIPVGWQRVPISDIYDDLFDGPHATPPPAEDGPVFLGIGNITESGRLDLSSVRHISEDDMPRWTKRVTPKSGDIVFTYEATLNRYAMVPRSFRGCLGRRIALIRSNPSRHCGRYLYLSFFSDEWRGIVAKNTLTGATVDRIPLTNFPAFPVNLPPLKLLAQFDDLVGPIFDQIEVAAEKVAVLRSLRDHLLPRLLSGELDVSRLPLPPDEPAALSSPPPPLPTPPRRGRRPKEPT